MASAKSSGEEAGSYNVKQLGALGDGKADDTEAIRAAIAKVRSDGGGEVALPAGRYRISGSLQLSTGIQLRGEGKRATRLIVPKNVEFDAISLEGASDVTIRDLGLEEENASIDGKPKGGAVAIDDGSRFVLVENVLVEGFRGGFRVGRKEKETVANVVFRNCRAERSGSFGFELNHCREVLLDSCYAFRHWLDGIKLRKQTRDVTIRGGEASDNGTSRDKDPRWNGNGVDAFAGGDSFLIDGLVVEYNRGSGIYMKTGGLQNEGFGTVGNAMISNVRCRYNIGSGLDINRSGGDLSDAPLLANVSVVGGVFEGNDASGIYVRARNVSVVAPNIRKNKGHGIDLASAHDTTVTGAMISGNGTGFPDGGYGIQIGVDPVKGVANRIRVIGGTINGVDDLGNRDGNDFSGSKPTHRKAILIAETASDVQVEQVTLLNWSDEGEPIANPGKLQVTQAVSTGAQFSALYAGDGGAQH